MKFPATLTYTLTIVVAQWGMLKSEPTLRINVFERGNPRCSACGQEFGSEGFAHSLIEAFALHVRRRHIEDELAWGDLRIYPSPTTARMVRPGTQQRRPIARTWIPGAP